MQFVIGEKLLYRIICHYRKICNRFRTGQAVSSLIIGYHIIPTLVAGLWYGKGIRFHLHGAMIDTGIKVWKFCCTSPGIHSGLHLTGVVRF